MRKGKSNQSSERGATLVEFALAVSVFLVSMFAVIEFGRAIWVHNALADAARRGARYAVLNSANNADAVKNVVIYGDPAGGTQTMVPNLTPSNVSVTYFNFGLNKGTATVSITNYQFQFVVPIVGTTITMPAYSTTLTGESVGFVPEDL